MIKRRDLIVGFGGAAAWPLMARAQRADPSHAVGVLMAFDENDPTGKARLTNFTRGLQQLGWADGRNLRMDVRWAGASVDRMRTFAKELVDLQPDVILANNYRCDRRVAAGNGDDPDRISARFRPGRLRLRCQPAAARR